MERRYTDGEAAKVLESLKMCKPDSECDSCVMHGQYKNGCVTSLIELAARVWEQQIDSKQCAIDTLLRLLEEGQTNGQF